MFSVFFRIPELTDAHERLHTVLDNKREKRESSAQKVQPGFALLVSR